MDWISSIDEFDTLQKLDGSAFTVIDELLDLLKISQEIALEDDLALVLSTSLEENL